jgi:hypothetical protein
MSKPKENPLAKLRKRQVANSHDCKIDIFILQGIFSDNSFAIRYFS